MKWSAFRALLSILALNAPPAQSTGSRSWTPSRKIASREATRELWHHGFDSYMHHAFPLDELSPVSCRGQGPDWGDPAAIHFNDVNANISLTLIDNLDSFIVLSNRTGFEHAVEQVLSHVSFDVDTKPQVFEVTIRALGGLLSAHLFASSEQYGFRIDGYTDALLVLAHDLGERLLPAFATPTGIPYARINLRRGVQEGESLETCSAGAGSLLLEFATLSRWIGDPRFETAARRAFFAVWHRRSKIGLVGNSINVKSGAWIEPLVGGVGAGIDSFYEYALKMYVLTGEQAYLNVWNDAYESIMKHSRGPDGFWYRTVGILTGELAFQHIDSLGAFWPGLQVLAGDIENAIKGHLVYWSLWKRYSGIPETFNIFTRQAISLGYPLRPEFIESTYFLYRATRDSFYLDVGERILEDLTRRAKVPCGLSTISNLLTSTREDRMESFALSESLKYLYLLFDEENVLNRDTSNFVFTTEGHMLAVHAYSKPGSATSKSSRHQNGTVMANGANSTLHSAARSDGYQGQPQCASYVAPRVGTSSTLRGSIRDRPDFEYARLLSGISVSAEGALGMGFPAAKDSRRTNESLLWPTATYSESNTKKDLAVATAADREWWDPNGWCEVPQAEEYVLEWIISSDGRPVIEDQAPSSSKVSVIPGGFIIYDVNGLRLRAVARIDYSGYDVTRIGPYPVRSGQKVIVKDPAVSASNPNALGDMGKSGRPKFAPDIYLRVSLPLLDSDDIVDISNSYDFPLYKENTESRTTMGIMLDVVAATATFGGNPAVRRVIATPGSDGAKTSPRPLQAPLIFGPESPHNGAIRVLRSEEHNFDGCEEHHPSLRYGNMIPPNHLFSNAGSTLQDSAHTFKAPEASVLFLKRGGCTFLRKLVAAKNAGFNGVIVWNSQDEGRESSALISPSVDEQDKQYAERELNDVVIVVIGRQDGIALDAMTQLAQRKRMAPGEDAAVVVEVFVDSPPLLAGDKGDGLEPVDPEEEFPPEDIDDEDEAEARRPSPRILHINGLALMNTIVV